MRRILSLFESKKGIQVFAKGFYYEENDYEHVPVRGYQDLHP